uniref:NADH dehydrogenase [ubiquinone] 1 alpha subcomplex subunit 11 n=1 Tax=Pinguiococcus pyrenoidosus TaxID=172671 RepID=A0A7R9U4J1_9STRA
MVNLAGVYKPECPARLYEYLEYGVKGGLIIGSVQVAWAATPLQSTNLNTIQSLGNITTRILKSTGWFTAVAATFSATECLLEGFRGKDDPWNAFFGGLNAGMLVSMHTRNPAVMLSTGVFVGCFTAAADASGETLFGDDSDKYFHSDPSGLIPKYNRNIYAKEDD